MCTAITFKAIGNYFGRTLDLEYSYDEKVTITPRGYMIKFKSGEISRRHYAIIGMATVIDQYPLYYDATNEAGLSIAALNFVGYASYKETNIGKTNVSAYELIIYLLSKCNSVREVVEIIEEINIVDVPFNQKILNADLHWLIADKQEAITIESTTDGIKIYNNSIGILTNNPPFDYHLMNLNNYCNISNEANPERFAPGIELQMYSKGMGGIGLPGDNSSMSRFVRASFNKLNSRIPSDKAGSLSQFFHILNSVEQLDGSVITNRKCNRTQYMSCCDVDSCKYYYKTYNNSQINCVNMFNEDLDSDKLIYYSLKDNQNIFYLN